MAVCHRSVENPGDVPQAGAELQQSRDRDRLFPASLTLFLTLAATQPGSQTQPDSGKCFGVFSFRLFGAFSGWWGSSAAAATEAGQILKFQFNHAPGHKLSGNNFIFVPQALSAAGETVVRGFCSAEIRGKQRIRNALRDHSVLAEGKWLCQLTKQPAVPPLFFPPNPALEQVCSTLHQGSSSQGSFALLRDSFPALLSSPHLTPNLLFHLHKPLYSYECSRPGHKWRPRSPILVWLKCEIWIKLHLGLFQHSQKGPANKNSFQRRQVLPVRSRTMATASVTRDLGSNTERLFLVVQPRSKGDGRGYKSTQIPSPLQQGFPSKDWLEFSLQHRYSWDAPQGCGQGGGRNFSQHPPWAGARAIAGSSLVLWEREADHQFLGMETTGKAFLIQTPVLEASAEADARL